MEYCELVVRNYRCFTDGEPCRVSIGGGFVALVGPNNSGKSSLLKMFRELRGVWTALSNGRQLLSYLQGVNLPASVEVVSDQVEIFCDRNLRPLSICIRLCDQEDPLEVVELELSSDRESVQNWRIKAKLSREGDWWSPQAAAAYGVHPGDPNTLIHGPSGSLVSIARIRSLVSSFAASYYIGPFRNALNVGTVSSYYDIAIGESFINTWNDWKTGASKANNQAITRVTEDIRAIFGFRQLDIAASIPLKTLALTIDDKPYKLSEVGAGLAQFVLVFGNALVLRPAMILIDEPELNLHPSLQVDFLTSLGSYGSQSTLFATHSIGLARSVADHIYSCQRADGATRVRIFEQTPSYAEFLGEMGYSTYRELGSESVLLVEGATDIKTVQQLLRKCKKDHEVVVLTLGGNSLARGGVEMELAEIKRLCSNISVLVDSEREKQDGDAMRERTEFAEVCRRLEFKVLVTELKAIENYFSDEAVKAVLGEKYSALGPYERLKDAKLGWDKSSNWRIARAMEWSAIANTDLGRFLSSL